MLQLADPGSARDNASSCMLSSSIQRGWVQEVLTMLTMPTCSFSVANEHKSVVAAALS
jgi:hypothetical protein